MSGTDGRAFGSPMAAATGATNACGSVGERIIRRSRISLFQDASESIQRSTEVRGTGTVELLGKERCRCLLTRCVHSNNDQQVILVVH